jgi:penicillin-binding protein 1A
VPLDRISPRLQQAVIAVEDANFLKHPGVDPLAITRALIRDIREGRWAEGGSTLTQQLTKILFLRPEKTIRRKIQEAMLAVQIEKTYTKEEILAFYLNQINFGHGRYGVEAAAQFYFGVPAADVSLEQAALLAGLVQRPTAYSPVRYPDRAAQRRNKVLERMAEEKYITAEEADEARAMPVEVVRAPPDNSIAPYFAEEIRKMLVPRYGDESLLRDGMVIRTGLDIDLQRAANAALSRGLRDLDKRRGFRRPAHNIVLEKGGTLDGYQHPRWDHPPMAGELIPGLVMRVTPRQASVRVGKIQSTLHAADAEWTGRTDLTRLLRPGDLTLFEVRAVHDDGTLALTLDQEP